VDACLLGQRGGFKSTPNSGFVAAALRPRTREAMGSLASREEKRKENQRAPSFIALLAVHGRGGWEARLATRPAPSKPRFELLLKAEKRPRDSGIKRRQWSKKDNRVWSPVKEQERTSKRTGSSSPSGITPKDARPAEPAANAFGPACDLCADPRAPREPKRKQGQNN